MMSQKTERSSKLNCKSCSLFQSLRCDPRLSIMSDSNSRLTQLTDVSCCLFFLFLLTATSLHPALPAVSPCRCLGKDPGLPTCLFLHIGVLAARPAPA